MLRRCIQGPRIGRAVCVCGMLLIVVFAGMLCPVLASELGRDTDSMNKLLLGMGSFPENGGRIELFGLRGEGDSSEMELYPESWLRVPWTDYNAASGEARVATGDIDGDGKDEIIIGFGRVSGEALVPAGLFQVLDDNYTHLAWGEVRWDDYNLLNGETWPSCGDLDGDGKDEVIIGLGPGGQGRIEVFEYEDGKLRHVSWGGIHWEEYNIASGEARPSVGDLDGDGKNEIVVGLGSVPEDKLVPGGRFGVLSSDFTLLSVGTVGWDEYNLANGETRPALGDLNGDGKDEIVVGLGAGGQGNFEIFEYVGNDVMSMAWRQLGWPEYNDALGEVRPVTGNVDHDEPAEILVGLGTGGNGWVELFDDALQALRSLTGLSVWGEDYNQANGETWPAVQAGAAPINEDLFPGQLLTGLAYANVTFRVDTSSPLKKLAQGALVPTKQRVSTTAQESASGEAATVAAAGTRAIEPQYTLSSTDSVSLAWDPSPNAVKYRIEVNTTSTWDLSCRVAYEENVTQGTLTISYLAENTVYYWRVWAGNEAGWSQATSGPSFLVAGEPEPEQPSYDLNDDGKVDAADLMLVAASWNKSASEAGYNEKADFNKDGKVDIFDVMMIAVVWKPVYHVGM